MVDTAKVKLYGDDLGILRWNSSLDISQFEYSPSFLSKGIEPSPLLMPVRSGKVYSFADLGKETFKGLPGMIADSLPDTYGRALLERWLALTGRTVGNPIETLCYLGKRCMGALEFEPILDSGFSRDINLEISSLVDVANEVLTEKEKFGVNLKEDKKKAIAEIVRLGTSAGGQRAKAIIAYNKETGEVKSGQVEVPEGFEYYLIKLDGVSGETGFKETGNYGRLEYSFYRLAKKAGIEMSESSLLEENGRAHFLTKRFDRMGSEKVHMLTLSGIAHYDFHLPRVYSYEQAFNVMRALNLSYAEAKEQYRRMVMNVVIRNQDDHTKNISFLMDRNGRWRLSPAYDLGFAYNPTGTWTSQHQMSINGKFDNITRFDLLEIAKKNNIKEAGEIIDEIKDHTSKWPELALDSGVPKNIVDTIYSQFRLDL